MENKNNTPPRAKLFNIKRLPMDMGRIVSLFMPLWFFLKKIYVNKNARKKLRGNAIIAANHTCFTDPLMLGCAFWYRRMFFLAAEVVMQNKLTRNLLKGIGCIEINRNICDMNAIRKAVGVLKEGQILAVFPQGGIDREDNVQAIKSGIVLIAMQAKAPIVPAYVYRKTRFTERNCVVIGEPIPAPGSNGVSGMGDIQSYADYVLEKMNECREIYENSRRKSK